MSSSPDTKPLSRWILRRGRDEAPPQKSLFRAGPLSCVFESGCLRYIRLGRLEVLRMIYAAVRDKNWDTVPASLSLVEVESSSSSFEVRFVSEHRAGEIDFVWTGTIRGDSSGTIGFTMDGEARSTFLRNRIGFCVLHPAAECAGKPCDVEKVDGSVEHGAFPSWISPGAPFKEILAIAHEIAPGLKARVSFEGEVFEMEDQRNWTDASYKTFCTPLAIPFPVEVKRGERIAQRVTIALEGQVPAAAEPREARTVITLDSARTSPIPRIGLGAASHGRPISAREAARLAALRPSHLRVDLKLTEPGSASLLRRAAADASAVGASLEAALHVSGDASRELLALAEPLDELRPDVSSFIVHSTAVKVTPEHLVRLARATLCREGSAARIGGGTDADFVEVNRRRPPLGVLDFACYAVNPQVHAFDDDSLVEALEGQRATVESARRLFGDVPIAVTPVTLKQRFNPNATGPPREPGPCELPPQVDARQMSLFGAAWTVGSLKRLAVEGVESLTFFETTGWRGVMETEAGSPDPVCFPSQPGAVFPLYHVLADAGEMLGGEVVASSSSDPLKADALALRRGGLVRVIVANFGAEAQEVAVEGLAGAARVRRLDETNAREAMTSPEAYRAAPASGSIVERGRLELSLPPYAVVRVDIEPHSRK